MPILRPERYVLYGGELSYFTRKLEAALILYGADFEFRGKTADVREELEMRSGTHQVPVLHTPENWLIGDTTPLLHLLDARFPDRAMFPKGPLGVLVHVLEEYFDEWVARTMVHFRWHYSRSAQYAALKMSNGNEQAAATVLAWGPRACRATGTESPHQQRAAEEEYVRILAAMEQQLGESSYMLGNRPTAVDCILLGGLRAHTYNDPDPKEITAQYPRVVKWCEEATSQWKGAGELLPFDSPTPFAQFILDEMYSTYRPYVLGNADAQQAGAKAFHVQIYGEDVSYLSRPYPEQSRRMVQQKIVALNKRDHEAVRLWLDDVRLSDCFA